MEEERDISQESSSKDDKPPMVNGMAVPIREAPNRSARPGKRGQPMDISEEYDTTPGMKGVNGSMENGLDSLLQVRKGSGRMAGRNIIIRGLSQ